jgi:hypothetical protein|tara:strand:- start:2257 stop:2829 length:573 start_codon:yes stop_codon:yes gene_type:complete
MSKEDNYFVSQDFDKYDLDRFMSICNKLGYKNNISRKAMKIDWVRKNFGDFWAFVKNDKIIAVSGCHPFPDLNDTYRIGFRAAQLPGEDPFIGLSKYGYNSISIRVLLQYQIKFCETIGIDNFILTTNSKSTGHLYMSHMMQVQINKCTNLTEYLGEKMLYGVNQSLWKYNINEYKKSILRLKPEKYYII